MTLTVPPEAGLPDAVDVSCCPDNKTLEKFSQ